MTGLPDDPLPDLGAFEKRIDALRKPEGPAEGPHQASGMGQAMRIGIELVCGTGVGAGLGYALDRWLETLPLFLILGFLLGTAGGIATIARTTRAMNEMESAENAPSAKNNS